MNILCKFLRLFWIPAKNLTDAGMTVLVGRTKKEIMSKLRNLLGFKKKRRLNSVKLKEERALVNQNQRFKKLKNLLSYKNLLSSNKGQALVELLVLSFAFISIIQLLFITVWIFINLIWMEHHLYQAVLCVSQERGQPFCKSQLLKDIKKLNPVAEIAFLNFNSSKGELKWRFYKQDFVIRQNFKLSH